MLPAALADDPHTPPSTWRALLCGSLLFLAVDCGLFRSGLYGWLAKPDSSSGWVSKRTLFEPTIRPPTTQPSIVLLGDSTMGEGCSSEQLQELLGGPPLTVRDASIPGTPLRVWPFVFRELRPPPGGWTLVVAGLSSYDDDCWSERMSERAEDLAFLGPMLGFADARELAPTFVADRARRDVWLMLLCKTYAWRRDLADLLASPYERYLEVRHQYGRMSWGQPYQGRDGDLVGVAVEGNRIVGLRPENAHAEAQLRRTVWPGKPADNEGYRALWLGKLADRATAAGSELVFVRMPLQVLPRATPRVPNTKVLDELARRPHVHVLDHDLFAELERPEYFRDGLHQNRTGRGRFTQMLADALRRHFGKQLGR